MRHTDKNSKSYLINICPQRPAFCEWPHGVFHLSLLGTSIPYPIPQILLRASVGLVVTLKLKDWMRNQFTCFVLANSELRWPVLDPVDLEITVRGPRNRVQSELERIWDPIAIPVGFLLSPKIQALEVCRNVGISGAGGEGALETKLEPTSTSKFRSLKGSLLELILLTVGYFKALIRWILLCFSRSASYTVPGNRHEAEFRARLKFGLLPERWLAVTSLWRHGDLVRLLGPSRPLSNPGRGKEGT